MDGLDPVDTSSYDPAATLQQDDPLRQWLQKFQSDPAMGFKLLTDPDAAAKHFADAGIPPPALPGRAMAFDEPSMGSSEFPVIGPNGKMMGNQTSIQGQPSKPPAVPVVAPPPAVPVAGPASAGGALDPAEEPSAAETVPLPRARPAEAGPGSSDISAQKKGDLSGAFTDFTKTLSAVKALQPPAVAPVGTPSVRSATAAGAPNIASILQQIGASQKPDPLLTLGRLLVAGKA